MSSDNRIFNVNGDGQDLLRSTLYFAFKQAGHANAEGWRISPEKGLILYWVIDDTNKNAVKFPSPLSSDTIAQLAKDYLNNEETWKNTKLDGWDADADHDGSNGRGWRVYCEDWGHVNNEWQAFLAIKPAYLWYGK